MNHAKSIEAFERAKALTPGGIHSNIRAVSEPVPLFYERAEGSHLWDIDGNEYVDYVLGQGPMLLGHTPACIIDAVKAQIDRLIVPAGQTELEMRAAQCVCDLVPCAEMVRFNSTGTEAVHAALRLARAATGRKKVLRFEGHYHGWCDTIAWNGFHGADDLGPREAPAMRPSSLGQSPEDGANLFVLPWNDLKLVQDLFDRHGSEIAAVIADPFACATGVIPGEPGFLRGLREVCDAHGALLIFDEVITGFRVSLQGAQGLYGVIPDLTTLAKALGGGMPVSAVTGRAKAMRLFGEGPTVHSGTYNANPPCMAAVVAALEFLRANDGAALGHAQGLGRSLMRGLVESSRQAGLPLTVRGAPTVFSATFLPEGAAPVVDMRSYRQTDFELGRRFWFELQERGIHTTSFGIWFVSTAHTEEDIERSLLVAREVLQLLAAEGR